MRGGAGGARGRPGHADQPITERYLGRVAKALILDAVRDGAGASAAARIEGMKKEAMAANAAELLDGTGWLPRPLRTSAADCRAEREEEDSQSGTAFLQAAE